MLARIAWRMMRETNPRLLMLFLGKCMGNTLRAIRSFSRRAAEGDRFPAFIFISLTTACNLSCQGCWVTQTTPPVELAPDTVSALITAAKRRHSRFFGLMGGEPLLYHHLFDLLAQHRDCYFQVFTNGTLLTDSVAARFRALGNVTPLVSIEGLSAVSDVRRGGTDVYGRALAGIAACRRHGLVTGVASSVCASNFNEVVTVAFIHDMVHRGVQYLWYYIYRPAGANPTPELALSTAQVRALRTFIVEARTRHPLVIVDAYWDHEGKALCPAATGISHHVNPWGDVEPCPPIQFACDRVDSDTDAVDVIAHSQFLHAAREAFARTSRGCILLENPAALATLVCAHGARDTSGRNTGLAELAALTPCPSHDMSGHEIPEKHWFYRFAKKHWFFGFGAYG